MVHFFKIGFLLISVLFVSMVSQAQNYSKKTFEEVKQFINTKSDTLYIINFWATWCKPCIEELPNFEKLQNESEGLKMRIILISLDSEKNWEKSLDPFIKKNKIASTIWVMSNKKPEDWIDQISPSWQGSIPATLFLKYNSGIFSFDERQFTYDELKTISTDLLTK